MRLLIVNEGIDDPGGVDTYLRSIAPALQSRGHTLAFMHYNARTPRSRPLGQPAFGVLDDGLEAAVENVKAWNPDAVFSHNMQALEVDAALAQRWPVVKMMHGYFGTCIGGQKAHLWPRPRPCDRRFGAACLALFGPCRCGQARPLKVWRQYSWARKMRSRFATFAAVVVASEHMRREYVRNGAPAARVKTLPLFAPAVPAAMTRAPHANHVVFLGRMTHLKGGDLLVHAAARASAMLGAKVRLTFAGDGSARRDWEQLANRRHVETAFTGWLDGPGCRGVLDSAALLVMPSLWPEPFGLVGLEASARGVPVVAFDVGGVREWLHDGTNGLLAGPVPDERSLANAIARVLSDVDLQRRFSEGGRKVAREMSLARHVDSLVSGVLEPAAGVGG